MSVIYGIIPLDGTPLEEQVASRFIKSLEKVKYDRSGTWKGDGACLGVFLRHNTPESVMEETPTHKDGLVIVSDSRIDNREYLFNLLNIPHSLKKGYPDNRLILESYQKWGEDCTTHLLGDFAFAVWDEREKTLFCVRDHIGFRPLYYYLSGSAFFFSSRFDALITVLPKTPEPDEEGVMNTFLILDGCGEKTLVKKILRLQAAHSLVLKDKKIKKTCYWRPQENSLSIKKGECHAALGELLWEAVQCRTRTAFPLGSHLSGGLDSSIPACIASQILSRENKTVTGFSWSFPPEQFPTGDERDDIEYLRKWGNFSVYYTNIEELSLPEFISAAVYDGMPNQFYREHSVVRKAADLGIRTLLSGWGGDEFITSHGSEYSSELLQRLCFFKLFREMQKHRKKNSLGLRGQLRNAFLPFLPYSLYSSFFCDYLQKDKILLLHKDLRKIARKPEQGFPSVRKRQLEYITIHSYLPRVEGWAAVGNIHGIAYTYPLLDKRVIDFCLSVPGELFCRDGCTRALARNALKGILPERVRIKQTKAEPGLRAGNEALLQKVFQDSCNLLEEKWKTGLFSRFFDDDTVNQWLRDLRTGTFRTGRGWIAVQLTCILAYLENISRFDIKNVLCYDTAHHIN